MVSVEKPFMHSLFKEVLDGKNILKTRNDEHMKLILATKLKTITIYSSIPRNVINIINRALYFFENRAIFNWQYHNSTIS